MRETLDRMRMAKYLQLLVHTTVFWGTVYIIQLVKSNCGIYFFSQYLILYCAVTLGVYAFRGFDMVRRHHLYHAVISIFVGILAGCLITIPVFILFYGQKISKLEMTLIFGTTFFGLSIYRAAASYFVLGKREGKKLFVIGDRERWEPLIREVASHLGDNLDVKAYINPTILHSLEHTPAPACAILVGNPEIYADPAVKQWTDRLRAEGCYLEFAPQLAEDTLGRIPLVVAHAFRNYYNMLFQMTFPQPGQRVLDLLVAVPGFIIGALLSLVIIPAIIIDSGFPVFYTQNRVGLEGNTFTMHKYRTMKNRENAQAAFADDDADLITPVGAFLRKFRLDEIPQLWDVLRGKMSIVGPRPEQPEFAAEYEEKIPFYTHRHRLRPGITGWAQVNYRYAAGIEDTKKKLEYDLYYLKNRDTLLDIQIILETAETMLSMRGAK
ncbi:MAG: sugar transferase [Synergistales bacterium]|nr:sugar transferase [Synergistales bacterium]